MPLPSPCAPHAAFAIAIFVLAFTAGSVGSADTEIARLNCSLPAAAAQRTILPALATPVMLNQCVRVAKVAGRETLARNAAASLSTGAVPAAPRRWIALSA